jgi:hypothetical protein
MLIIKLFSIFSQEKYQKNIKTEKLLELTILLRVVNAAVRLWQLMQVEACGYKIPPFTEWLLSQTIQCCLKFYISIWFI